MSADPASKPVHRADDDVLGRLAVIDQRLRHVSTQLATIGTLLSQLDEIHANLETLIGVACVGRADRDGGCMWAAGLRYAR